MLPAQTRVLNDLPYNVFDTGTVDGFKGAVINDLCFSVFRGAGPGAVTKIIHKQFCLSHLCV